MSLGIRCECGHDLAVLYFIRVSCPKCGREYQIDGAGFGVLVKLPTPGFMESSQLQQSRKEFIPSESRTEVDPRLKYLVVYDNRYQGVTTFEDKDEAIKCACDYATAGHKDVVMYIRNQPEELEPFNPNDFLAEEVHTSVIHPVHYNSSKYEVWDVLDEWFRTLPLLWQAGKYLARAFHKNNPAEDMQKAIQYIQRQIDSFEKEMKNG